VLVTLDLDFADIRSYPPDQYPGLIVMRVGNQSRTHVLAVFKNMLPRLLIQSLAGRLWIVDEHSVRVHESVAEAEGE
jgi:predicted nuclease of predicted toxin-antitoxin system